MPAFAGMTREGAGMTRESCNEKNWVPAFAGATKKGGQERRKKGGMTKYSIVIPV